MYVRGVSVLCAIGLSGAALGQVVVLGPARDNTLFETTAGDRSNGAGPNMFVGRNGLGEARRGLIAFDLTAIPAGSVITGVELTMQLSNTSAPATADVSLHRTLADWGEGTSSSGGGQGAPAASGDATWLHTFYSSSLWATPGGDFDGNSSATTPVTDLGAYAWSSAGMIADVQGWLDDPSSNHGWAILGNEAVSGNAKRFDTGDHPDPGQHPQLTVTFVPTPSGVSVLAAGLLLVSRRRR